MLGTGNLAKIVTKDGAALSHKFVDLVGLGSWYFRDNTFSQFGIDKVYLWKVVAR